MYELRPAVKQFCHFYPKVCFLCSSCVPSCQPYSCEFHRQMRWICKLYNNFKVLMQLYFTSRYIKLYVHVHKCRMTSKMQVVHNIVVMLRYCLMFSTTEKKNSFGDDNRPTIFLTSFISTYFYVVKKIIFPE
jgi:hypothetical protein